MPEDDPRPTPRRRPPPQLVPPPQPDADAVPLCVNLKGTLIRGGLLHQSIFALLGERPGRALKLPSWLAAGKTPTLVLAL